jgi:lambda family phage portal protein
MFSWLWRALGLRAGRSQRRAGRSIHARYDAAQTTSDNRRHWSAADSLSAVSAHDPATRRVLRNRARYEVANNSYARGIVNTLANDVIGTGPRLQMLTANPDVNQRIETAFLGWAKAVKLAEKLRMMRLSRVVDGESFAILTGNRGLANPVQLDLRPVEADQVSTPDLYWPTPNAVDGIVFDSFGNPTEYHVLQQHPGGVGSMAGWSMDYDRYPASSVLHWLRRDRPGQVRGVPEITPALPLFAQLRRYTLAVLTAAETAADFAAFLKSSAPADTEEEAVGTPWDALEIERGMLTQLPADHDITQLKPEQPTTTYAEFKHEILNEIARCLNMPFNVAAGNSSGYNYASGRLDHQTYYRSIGIDQNNCEGEILDVIFAAWLAEAVLIPGYLPGGIRDANGKIADQSHQWFWDGNEHVDPLKEANAQAVRLANHTTTLAEEYGKRGKDWENNLRQRAKEKELMESLGLPLPGQPMQPSEDPEEVA